MSKATISAEEFDRLVDEGKEDVVQYFDLENARRGGPGVKRINIDLPNEFLAELDREATRRGITRQSLIKVWLYEKLHGDSVTVQWESALSGVITSQNWPKGTSSLREAVIGILENSPRPLRTSDVARELENQKKLGTQSTKIVRSAKGTKRLIRKEKLKSPKI
jgi:hypothetical protein